MFSCEHLICNQISWSQTLEPLKEQFLPQFFLQLILSDIRSSSSNCHLIKFADDTALLGLIHKDEVNEYTQLVNKFVEYCDDNFLVWNVSKITVPNRKYITEGNCSYPLFWFPLTSLTLKVLLPISACCTYLTGLSSLVFLHITVFDLLIMWKPITVLWISWKMHLKFFRERG